VTVVAAKVPPGSDGSPLRGARPHLLGEILIVLLLVKVYDYIRSLAEVRSGSALANGRDILAAERVLRLDVEQLANRWLDSHQWFSFAATWWYQLSHLGVTLTVLVWCYVRRPDVYRPARNALVVTNLVGLAGFALFPVMPPRLLPGSHYVDTVAAAGFGASHAGPVPADQYGAMPSLHLAWATWVAIIGVALLRGKVGRWLALGYPTVTAVVVVATANHYVLDVVAGVVVAVGAVQLASVSPGAGRWTGRLRRQQTVGVGARIPRQSRRT
jgi:PAP2 superfamily protein